MKLSDPINRILEGAAIITAQLVLAILAISLLALPVVGGILLTLEIASRAAAFTGWGYWVSGPIIIFSFLFCGFYVAPVLSPCITKAGEALADKKLFPDE